MSGQGERNNKSVNTTTGIGRREFCQTAALGLGGLIAGKALGNIISTQNAKGPLLPPAFLGNSIELCLNSRASEHSGLTGLASEQQQANILWAAGKAPFVGTSRTIYAATPDGTFIYDPQTHSLNTYSSSTTSNCLRITYDTESYFDAGLSYMPAFAASVDMWDGTSSQMASCPQGSAICYGIRSVQGIKTNLVAVSTDGSLPHPTVDGSNSAQNVISRLRLRDRFRPPADLTLNQLSQLLWGAYGCTPHTVNSSRQGLTVPSSWARYPMTDSIYIVQDKVWRYCNRQGSDLTTADHRIELVYDADVRADLAAALGGLPHAPCYILLCIGAAQLSDWYSLIEVGFAAGSLLLQATAIDLGCAFQAPLASSLHSTIQTIANIPTTHYPNAAIAVGQLPEDVEGDGDIDLDDHAELTNCLNGPNAGTGSQCIPADIDADGDIDLKDFADFQRAFRR